MPVIWPVVVLNAAVAVAPVPPPPLLGEVLTTMREHAQMLFEYYEGVRGIRDFRKHANWYVTGYAVGPEMRRRLGMVDSLDELDALINEMDHTLELPPGGQRIARGHTNGPRPVSLPHGYLDNLNDDTPPSAEAESMANGG